MNAANPIESADSYPSAVGYDPFAANACALPSSRTFCSDVAAEPLPGSARTGGVFVLYEHAGPWSHDILDGGTFSAADTETLKQLPGLYLIRKPGRIGRQCGPEHNTYLVFCEQGITKHLMISSIDELGELDLTSPDTVPERAREITEPQLLVCTHAKRDRCCAIKGRPIAQDLVRAFPDAPIWECSHTKGHRFAPSMMLFPWAYFYGRLNSRAAQDVYSYALQDKLFLPGNRGRGIFTSQQQVAEIAVLEKIFDQGETPRPGVLTVAAAAADAAATSVEPAPQGQGIEKLLVTHRDGRGWLVTLEQREASGVIPSCGDQPKTAQVWVATSVARA